jgi:DNA-binding NarL/FixJ family response regulator
MSYRAQALQPEMTYSQASPYTALDAGGHVDSSLSGSSAYHGATDQQGAPLRIFLVEDSAMLRDRLSEAFSTWGKITMAGHAETEAVADAALRTCEWDVLILDLQLLQGTGLGVLRNLRGHRKPGTAVIVLTNYAIPSYRARSMELGADYFFDKTKDFAKIKEVFNELADKRQGSPAQPLESAMR